MHIADHDKQSLILSISAAVRGARATSYGTYLAGDFANLSLSDGLNKALRRNLDRGGLSQFVQTQLHKLVLRSGAQLDDDAEDGQSVVDIPGFDDHVQVATRVVDELATLPWEYRIFVRGPRHVHAGTSTNRFLVPITDRLELGSSEHYRSLYQFDSDSSAIDEWIWSHSLEKSARKFADLQLYFCYKYSGYVGISSDGRATDELQYEMRAFYGACIAHDLILPFGYDPEPGITLVFLSHREGSGLEHSGLLGSDLQRATYYYSKHPLSVRFRSQASLIKALSPVASLFNCSTSQRLKTAAVWVFRAATSENSMDKVLESAIALEVLLGDRKMSDKVGLTRLMSNRCAYALGKSQAQRDEIQEFFEAFYSLRSEIVHTGRLSLDEAEESLIERGLRLAAEMLSFEQSLACA